ncbi:hypothetical protein [Anaerosporobacter faecicola]|uniref:hypothetical protein n=1 Tax=Anaerosporobacter faecicola TaxID=2718714 RepID=UPI00143A0A93|nr:hypothetical protein [Anaerosporobacter faecicola]
MSAGKKQISILICIICLILTGCNQFTRTETQITGSDIGTSPFPIVMEEEESGVQVTIVYGLNGYAKVGKSMRVKMVIRTLQKSFNGYIAIILPNRENEIQYDQKIEVSADETTTYITEIPVFYEDMPFVVTLKDNRKKEITSVTANVQANSDIDNQYVGVMDKTIISDPVYEKGKITLFQLNDKEVMDSFENIGLLDYIIMEQEQYSLISKSISEQLEDWLNEGGILLLEEQSDLTKNRLVETEEQKNVTTFTRFEAKEYGLGKIIEIPKLEDSSNLTDYIEAIGSNKKLFLTTRLDNEVRESINAGTVSKIPNILTYVALLGAFILLIGPCLYCLLKKVKKRIWYWYLVPVISMFFVVIVYMVGKNTRIDHSYIRYVTMTEIAKNGFTKEATYFAAVSPKNQTLEVYAAAEEALQPLFTISDNYQVGEATNKTNLRFSMNVENTTGEENNCLIENVRAFQPTYFQIGRTVDGGNSEYSNWETEPITCTEYRISGTFVNTLGVDLTNACILSNHTLVQIGELKKGEEVDLASCVYDYIPSYDMLFTDNMQKRIFSIAEGGSAIESDTRNTLLSHIINEWSLSNADVSYLVGFKKDTEPIPVRMEELDNVELGSHVILKELPVEYQMESGDTFHPSIKEYMTSVNGEYYEDLDIMDSDLLTVTYDFHDMDIKQIAYTRHYNMEFYEDLRKSSDMWIGFYGTVYFYNQRTESYDTVIQSGEETVIDQLEDYLGQNHILKVKFEASAEGINSNINHIPTLTAIEKKE